MRRVRPDESPSPDDGWDRMPVSSNPVIADLEIERNELAHTWKTFIRWLSPADRLDTDEQPTAHNVATLVHSLQSCWRSRPRQQVFSDAMTLCDQFIPTLDTHARLLALLPNSDRYHAPLFFGVLQSVLKASSNYPRVIEALMTALLNIHSALVFPTENITPANVPSLARVYALVFFFLTEFMDCARHKPLSGSSGSMAANNHHDSTHSPRALWEESQLSQVGRQGHQRRIATQNTMTRRLIWEIQHDAEERTRIREQRDELLAQVLGAARGQLHPVSEQSSGTVCLTTAAPDLATSQFEWSRGSKRRLARIELQAGSKHLQEFFDGDDQIADFEPDVEVAVEGSVITSLEQWIQNPRSQALAVGGSPSTVFPSPVALISACYASFARRARLPVISHFCALPTQEVAGQTLQQKGLIGLTYSLIRQLIDCLPTMVDSDSSLDLSVERFRNVDGTFSSWTTALSLVDTLLNFAPPLLVCIIDGLDVIHDPSTDAEIRQLIRVLLTHTRFKPQPGASGTPSPVCLFKVLFTAAGRPSALVETMSENQLILSETARSDELSPSDAVLASDLGVVMMNA
ncbi:hypothetical protein N7492_005118 [Penicillium capsulatum]|uniref:Uncharacterized protein n=1 Tax=Penicillium capsulatum TaxID=69766 RepID=A0A9W9LRL3_9EURO|nr:hypothetical protein N7492_005118 [Penicillium capsulatum]